MPILWEAIWYIKRKRKNKLLKTAISCNFIFACFISAHLNRVQRQLLSLISHFGLAESALKKSGQSSRDAQFVLEAHANTILFARNFISKGSSSRLIFAPSLIEATFKSDGHGSSELNLISF